MLQPSIVGTIGRGDGTTFYLPHLSDIAVQKGMGALTFTRGSGCWDTDFENKMVYTASGSPSFPGMRLVTNYALYSDDMSNGVWAAGGGLAGVSGEVLTFSTGSATDFRSQIFTFPVGSTLVFSVELKAGTKTKIALSDLGAGVDTAVVTLTPQYKRYAISFVTTLATQYISLSNRLTSGSDGVAGTVYARNLQVEDVTTQSNKNLGEYVRTPAATPATKWFSTVNPNYVPMNRLTWSEDFGNAVWPKGGTQTGLNNTFTVGAADGYMYHNTSTVAIGETATLTFRISGTVGKKVNVYIMNGVATAGVYKQVVLSATPTEYSLTLVNAKAVSNVFFHSGGFLGCSSGDFNLTATVHQLRLETGPVGHEYYKTTSVAYTPYAVKDASKRVVLNRIVSPEDFSVGSWIKIKVTITANQLAPDGTLSATRLTFSDATSEILQQNTLNEHDWCYTSCWIKGTAGETIALGTSGSSSYVKTLTGEWERYADLTNVSTTSARNTFIGTWGSTARIVDVWHPMLEILTDTSHKFPSEYINGSIIFEDAPVLESLSGATQTLLLSQVTPPSGATLLQLRMGTVPGGMEYGLYSVSIGANHTNYTLPTDGSIVWISLFWQINGSWSNPLSQYYIYKCASSAGADVPLVPRQYSGMFIDSRSIVSDNGKRAPIKSLPYMQSPTKQILGPNVLTNGDFSGGTTGWAATNCSMSVVSGEMEITRTGSTFQYIKGASTVTAGKLYQLSIDAKVGSGDMGVILDIQINASVVEPLGAIYLTSEYTRSTFQFVGSSVNNNGEVVIIRSGTPAANAGSIKVKNITIQEVLRNDCYTGTDIAPVLGSELIVNGDFSSGSASWGSTAPAYFVNGVCEFRGDAANSCVIAQSIPTIPGKIYKATATLNRGTLSSQLYFQIGTTSGGFDLGYDGVSVLGLSRKHEVVFTATTTATFINAVAATASVGTTATVDNVSVKEVIDNKGFALYAKGRLSEPASTNKCTCYGVPRADGAMGSELLLNSTITGSAANWVLGTGWTYGSDKVTANGVLDGGSGTGVEQAISYTLSGKMVWVTIAISGYIQGNIRLMVIDISGKNVFIGTTITANGTYYEQFIVPPNATRFMMVSTTSVLCQFSIDSLSMRELIDTVYAGGSYGQNFATIPVSNAGCTVSTVSGRTRLTGTGTTNYPQVVYVAGINRMRRTTYRLSGSAWSDGVNAPQIINNMNTVWSGVVAANSVEQKFDITYTIVSTIDPSTLTFYFYNAGNTAGMYVEFKDVSHREVLEYQGTKTIAHTFNNPEIITNASDRDFSSDTGFWSKGTGWTISGGSANHVAGSNSQLSRAALLTVGKTYDVSLTVVGYGGGATLQLSDSPTVISGFGTYIVRLVATVTSLQIWASSAGTLSIDNLSVKEVTFNQNFTNMIVSGDTNAILSIANDQAELEAAGLARLTNNYKVYKLDNSLGTGPAQVTITGAASNSNVHTASALIRGGSGGLGHYTANTAITVSQTYRRLSAIGASASGWALSISATYSQILYFILPQFEELPYASSLMPCVGGTANRLVAYETVDVNIIPKTGDFYIYLEFLKYANGGAYIINAGNGNEEISLYTDTNYLALLNVAGNVINNIAWSGTLDLNRTHKVVMIFTANHDVLLYMDGVKLGENLLATARPAPAYMYIGKNTSPHEGTHSIFKIVEKPITGAEAIALTI